MEDPDELANSIKYQCFSNGIAISLNKNRLSNFSHSSFHLNDKSCTGKHINTTHIRLQTELDDCGTLKEILLNGTVMYTNRVYGYLKGEKNKSESASKTFQLKCIKPYNSIRRNGSTLKSDIIAPHISTQENSLAKVGHLLKDFSLQQENVSYPGPQLPITYETKEIVQNGDEVKLTAEFSTKHHGKRDDVHFIGVAVENCHTSSDEISSSSHGTTLIENGCVSAPRLCGYFFQQKSPSQTITYKLPSSKDEKNGRVYIQCRFILCRRNDTEPLCIFGCRPNRKLNLNETRSVTVKAGPFSVKEPLAVERKAISVSLILEVGTGLLALVAVGVFLFIWKQRQRDNCKDNLISNDEGLIESEMGFDISDTALFDGNESLEAPKQDELDSCAVIERRKWFLDMDWTTV
ncbi:hypothetical protein AWC38_SpisGene1264 [Stylophora pistillata]|uniref:ZP domain-containing protein n=1 Tax=Stylophora pistillata TaxID=50429 RepID=A0A2B4SZG3_STYPI|nr:hypothetical protein AWC38_SpisGene1264 [Stylophora pistillata]